MHGSIYGVCGAYIWRREGIGFNKHAHDIGDVIVDFFLQLIVEAVIHQVVVQRLKCKRILIDDAALSRWFLGEVLVFGRSIRRSEEVPGHVRVNELLTEVEGITRSLCLSLGGGRERESTPQCDVVRIDE